MYPFSFFSSKIPLVIIGKKEKDGGKMNNVLLAINC